MNKNIHELLKMPTRTVKQSQPIHEPQDSQPKNSRRQFFQKAGLGGLSLGAFMHSSFAKTFEQSSQNVNKLSNPSDLKITDLRVVEVANAPMPCPVIRIDTNQGIYGLGEVRDHASPKYALFLKSRLLGENPCNVDRIFKKIKQFGGHSRQAGGVCAVEMALWDLTGKAYGVPAYQLVGGKFRDKVRLYCDTAGSPDPITYAKRMKERVDQGFSFLKMDFGIQMLKDEENVVINSNMYDIGKQWSKEYGSYGTTAHPFTRIQITNEGLEKIAEYVKQVRDVVGYEIPLAADHFGHFDTNECIRLGRVLEPYRLAYLEDLVPWQFTEKWKEITNNITTPTLTGEDIYLKEEFIKLIDARAIDMVHPDLASSGGILETKKIGDYAEEHGIPMMMHFAGTPVSMMANVHCAAATQNFIALEHHSVDIPWWEDLVTGIDKPIVQDGHIVVPEKPGLGVELNEDVVKEHMKKGTKYFAPTPEWNTIESADRLWS